MGVIEERITGFRNPRGQPDQPHHATIERKLARQTQALAYRCSSTRHQWTWGAQATQPSATYPDTYIPIASITAAQTWTVFQIGPGTNNQDLQFPWRFTESHAYIYAYATVLMNAEIMVAMKFTTTTLLSAIAATNSLASNRAVGCTTPLTKHWQDRFTRDDSPYLENTIRMRIITPTVPADRTFVIKPYIQTVESRAAQYDLSRQYNVFLTSFALMDVPYEDAGV